MSYDLYLFYSSDTQTNQSAANLLEWFVPRPEAAAPEIAAYVEEFLNGAQEIGGAGAGEEWRGEFEISADGLLLHLPAGTPHKVTELVMTLADKHGLFLFDPQIGEIITGPSYIDENAEPPINDRAATITLLPILLAIVAGAIYWLFF
jgi:hypothetical protein